MRRKFKNGFEAMRRLDHPRVVRVYESTEFPVGFFMEYVPGPNFRQIGGEIKQDAETLVRFLRSIAQTVAHAHERRVLHRDLKPENILAKYDVTEATWHAHLTDFDLAVDDTRSMSTKEAKGAIHYSAPEQLMRPESNESPLAYG